MPAQIKLDEILEEKGFEIRQAMHDVLEEYAPTLVDRTSEITRKFIRRVDYHTLVWTTVSDRYVEKR